MAGELRKALLDLLAKPKSYTVDGETITNHSLPDLVEALKYAAKADEAVASDPFKALKVRRIITQGPEKR